MIWNEIGGFNQNCEMEWVSGKFDDIQNEIDDLEVKKFFVKCIVRGRY